MIMQDCKDGEYKNWSEIVKELGVLLEPFLKKHDMTIEKMSFVGFYWAGEYAMNGYGEVIREDNYKLVN